MAEGVVGFACGRQYARPELSLRDRYLATVAALAALGGQTTPHLKVDISGGRKSGLSQKEIAEVIWQMSLYGGVRRRLMARMQHLKYNKRSK
jgi:4-carboxymuconolactone decarboxylase